MRISTQLQQFLLFAIICCFLSVITTLGIHSSLFDLGELSENDQITLFKNPTYIANRFWVIVHCLLVLVSMLGFLLMQKKKSPGLTILGFIFFTVFSFTEIFRQMFVFFYMNNLRRFFLKAEDVALQEVIKINMEHAGLVGNALFGLFILSFALGTICYGISLLGGNKFDYALGYLMVLWGIGNLIAFGNEFWFSESLGQFIEYFSTIYQPLMRVLIGIWMVKKFKDSFAVETSVSNIQSS